MHLLWISQIIEVSLFIKRYLITMGNIYSHVNEYLMPEVNSYKLYLTGDWREVPVDTVEKLRQEITYILADRGAPFTVHLSLLNQYFEADWQARSALAILDRHDLIKNCPPMASGFAMNSNLPRARLGLFVGAGRGSTQMTIINLDNHNIVKIFRTSGFPMKEEPDWQKLKTTAKEVADWADGSICFIAGFDAIFHILKTTGAPIIPDFGKLPDKITTRGRDFDELGFLTEHFKNVPMIVFRNVCTSDGLSRKVSFVIGDEVAVDGGSGKWSIISPSTGSQLEYMDLPKDWKDNEERLPEIAQKFYAMMMRYYNTTRTLIN